MQELIQKFKDSYPKISNKGIKKIFTSLEAQGTDYESLDLFSAGKDCDFQTYCDYLMSEYAISISEKATLSQIKDEEKQALEQQEEIQRKEVEENLIQEQEQQEIINNNRNKYENIEDEELRNQLIKASSTTINDIAKHLNQKVFLKEINWKLLLLSALSVSAPKITTTSGTKKNGMNTLLVGEPSTSKSVTLNFINQLFSNSIVFSDFTKASFLGVASKSGIEQGVIDEINNKILLIKEYNDMELPYKKEVLEGSRITIVKGGFPKSVSVNSVVMGAINPKQEWFQREAKMSYQLSNKDTELGRFAFILPLVNDRKINENIVNEMDFFCDKSRNDDIDEFGVILATITASMKTIKNVKLTESQKDMLRQIYKKHNTLLNNVRSNKLVLRDFEILLQLVNTIISINNLNREVKDGVINATDEDIKESIELFEHITSLKTTLYENENREFTDLNDKIYQKIYGVSQGNEVYATELEKSICQEMDGKLNRDFEGNPMGLCSRSTLYRAIQRLVIDKKVKIIENKPLKIVLVG